MKPLHQTLPSLEAFVAKGAEQKLQALGPSELRTLIHNLLDGYRRRLEDPEAWFDAMVTAANDRADTIRSEQQVGTTLRAQVLSRLLYIAARALPAISNTVRTKIVRGGADQQYTLHPLLRGIELGGSRKQLAQADGVRAIVGRTWWVVALSGNTAVPDARWAIMDHSGSIDAKGFGEERISITLSDPIDLAQQVNDRVVGTMLLSLSTQLRHVDDDRAAAQTEAIRMRLDRALRALQDDR